MSAPVLAALGKVSLSGAVLILAVLVLRLRFQDRTPWRAFCLLWDIVLVRLLVPMEIPSPLSIRRWLPGLVARTAAVQEAPIETAVLEAGPVSREAWVSGEWVTREYAGFLVQDALQPGSAPALPFVDWGMVLTALCLAASLLLAGHFLWRHIRSRRVYAASLPCRDPFVLDWLAGHPLRRPVQARTSDQIAAPLTYGVLYPVILLPSGMDWRDREVLSCVLAHEHTHIRRFDALRKLFLAAALCLHWFNPLVWVMYALASRDIELACDEAVLRADADRERYALALLGLEERRGRWSPSGSHFSGSALEERIKAIMKRKHISITALVAVLVVMCVTTTVFASAAPEDREDPHQNAPETGYVYDHLGIVEDNGVSIMSKGGENGEKLYSADDGKTWMTEERYHAEYGSWGDDWQVEWWTYEDYKAWLEEEKAVLQSMTGEQGYNGTDGWFTWDQKNVDETIALYESILEDVKNGALHSKTIIDKNGREVEDVALGSDGFVIASTFEEGKGTLTAPKELDEAALLEELKAFGIGGNANLMTYNGQLIRHFVDGAPVGDDGYSVQYVYTNNAGTVDVHTLRSVIYNPDGSYDTMGDLIGVAAKGDRGFDQELIEAATVSGPQAAYADDVSPMQDQNGAEPAAGAQTVYAEGTGGRGGKTFEEIFTRYADYGLTYQPRESGMGALTLNGQPVRSFADLRPDGSAFSYADPYAETGLTVTAQYDQNGKLTGLSAE